MAARFKTRAWTLTGGADTLETILNSSHDYFVSGMTVRAAKSNAGEVTWEDEDGEVGGRMEPNEGSGWDMTGKFVKTNGIIFRGTLGDIVNLTVVG